ncbi:hypothetical protein D3C86_1345460 [compost metagenome]
MIVECRNDRRHHHGHGNAGLGQRLHRVQPLLRRGGARLHVARELAVQRRHGNADLGETLFGHGRQNVDIPLDQRRFGDDGDGMIGFGQHFQYLPHDAPFALNRLIRVGIGANGDHPWLVARFRQFPFQQLCRIRLGEELRFEIQTGRKSHIAVCRSCETIDTAMFAAAIGIDGAVERDVGRFIAGDDAARLLHLHLGAELRHVLESLPAIVENLVLQGLETSIRIEPGATAATAVDLDAQARCIGQRIGNVRHMARLEGSLPRKRMVSHLDAPRTSHAFRGTLNALNRFRPDRLFIAFRMIKFLHQE